jgi:type VI secretion system protein ImpA
LQVTAANVARIRDNVTAIESMVTERVGELHAVQLHDLTSAISAMHKLLAQRVAARPPIGLSEGTDPPGMAGQLATGASDTVRTVNTPVGSIGSRADVVRVLDSLCSYYAQNEPSSPIPLLLRRAQRLVPMTFLDILRDLAPGGVGEAEKIRGPEESDGR